MSAIRRNVGCIVTRNLPLRICYVSSFGTDFRLRTESIKCRNASERQPSVAPRANGFPQNKKRIRNKTPKQKKSTDDKRKLNQCSYWILPLTPAERRARENTTRFRMWRQ